MVVPIGFRFNPTDQELINVYLWPKIMGQRLVSEFVEEKQLYGPHANPWQVLLADENKWVASERDAEGRVVKKSIYVFTKLTRKAKTIKKKIDDNDGAKEQFVRRAGCGVWVSQTCNQVHSRDGTQVIANKRMLNFAYTNNSSLNPNPTTSGVNPGHWIMHEFSLPNGVSDYVVCEISLDLRKKTKIKRGVIKDQDHEDDDEDEEDEDEAVIDHQHPAKRIRKR